MQRKAKYEADLHCHTAASDGLLSPGDTIRLAVRMGLQAMAITDHDTIDGWSEAQEVADKFKFKLVNGIEINTDWQGKEVHILGYGLNESDPVLQSQLLGIQGMRVERIKGILKKLEVLGMELSFFEVMQYVNGESAGRPHVAQAMVAHGFVTTVKEAFDQYLRIGSPAYVPRYKLTPTEAIRIIRDAGGVAVIAHPGSKFIESEIHEWTKVGLQGIEVSHPDHTFEDTIHYGIMAERLGLIATGGSDFHGPGIKPGIELGDWGVGLEIVENIEEMVKENRKNGREGRKKE